jgi:hypothetical protein
MKAFVSTPFFAASDQEPETDAGGHHQNDPDGPAEDEDRFDPLPRLIGDLDSGSVAA